MQAGLTPVKSDKLKDCKNIHRQAMRVRVSFAYVGVLTATILKKKKVLFLADCVELEKLLVSIIICGLWMIRGILVR